MRALGVSIALDDFGSGYSSLSYLCRLPIDGVKLDRAFVADAADGTGRGRQMIEAVVNLSHALGLWVIAEGVEQPEQADTLRRLGCDFAQGFHFARPLDAAGLEAFLLDRPGVLA